MKYDFLLRSHALFCKQPLSFLSVLAGLSTAKRKFADSLNEFKFQCIGDAETDDEICIGELDEMKPNISSVPAAESL